MKTKTIFLFCFLFLGCCSLQAQTVEFSDLDKSPMDAAHYPRRAAFRNYLEADDADRDLKIKVLYSRPMKKGREIFGGIVPFGEDYRLGANEATEITFYQPVEIGTTRVPAGTYTLFANPQKDAWTFKLSTERFIGGSQNRDVSKDILSFKAPVTMVDNVRESFAIGFQDVDAHTVHMLVEWDKTRVALPINLSPPTFAGDDASPMDLVQFPNMSRLRNFVKAEEMAANEPRVRVVYSRPQLKDRKAFGGLLKYGEMWRAGANETTTVTLFKDAVIGGKKVEAGTYGLFVMVKEGEWEFILHNAVQSWGNPNFDDKDTVVKVKAETEKTPKTLEALTYAFVDRGNGLLDLVLGWENTMARLPIEMKK